MCKFEPIIYLKHYVYVEKSKTTKSITKSISDIIDCHRRSELLQGCGPWMSIRVEEDYCFSVKSEQTITSQIY